MQQTHPDTIRLPLRIANMVIAARFMVAAMLAAYWYIRWPPVIIVGGSGIAGFVFCGLTFLRRALPPAVSLPALLLAVASRRACKLGESLTSFVHTISLRIQVT